MNYTEAVDYIFSVPKFTKKNKPENTAELMERLGRPERGKQIIHVAGSNGKGSVCAFLSSILVKAGKRTGLFTSPHLIRINERFQINNEPVSDEEFLRAYEKVQDATLSMQQDGFAHPTYFELVFAIAMVLFQEKEAQYIVLETGLGGRLDATNVVKRPIATVITSLSLEHTEILGDTIEKIAGEKAGIIKPGVPVIYVRQDERTEAVIKKRADELNAPATALDTSMYEILMNTEKNIDFLLNCGYYENTEVTIPYLAEYQVMNSALALRTIDVIDTEKEIPISVRVEGIRETKWQGRMETVMGGVIFDGAHNAQGVKEFVKTVKRVQKDHRIVMLFSAVVEKDYEQMIKSICLETEIAAVFVTEIAGDRVVLAEELAEIFGRYTDVPVSIHKKIGDAFEAALKERGEGLLFCVGSLYLIGELKHIVKEKLG